MLKLFNFSSHPRRFNFHLICKYRSEVQSYASDASITAHSENRLNLSMRQYFEEHGLTDIVKHVPENYLQRSKKFNFCTIVSPQLAKKIAFSICSRMEQGRVVESDPGFGFMSQVLVSVFPRLFLCEKNEDFRLMLNKLKKNHENMEIIDVNVDRLFKMIISVGAETIPEVTEFYQRIENKTNANDLQRINWIFPALTRYSIKTLCMIHLVDKSFLQLGKMTYFIILPSTLCDAFNYSPCEKMIRYMSPVSALFRTIFNYEILMTGIPRKMFLPWPTLKNECDSELLLIHVVPKDNIENLFDSDTLIKSFLKFLQIGLKKKQRVVPLLEKFINNCGPLFILEHDLTIYTEFLELSPEKILSIFMTFSKLPEFSHSTFVDDDLEVYSDEQEARERNYEEDPDESEDDEDSQSENDDEPNEMSDENLKHF